MSRTPYAFAVQDISVLARGLCRDIGALGRTPGHVEMLNLLARAGGFRNFQHLRARHEAHAAPETPAPPPVEVDDRLVKKLAGYFDGEGRLARWPGKHTHRMACVWAVWARIPARAVLSEREISQLLDTLHGFGDAALLRRWLVDHKMVARTPDGREYRRQEVRPPAEALALLERLRSREQA